MITLEKFLDLWSTVLGAKAEAEMQKICGCGATKSRQYDREGNVVGELICPDCGV